MLISTAAGGIGAQMPPPSDANRAQLPKPWFKAHHVREL